MAKTSSKSKLTPASTKENKKVPKTKNKAGNQKGMHTAHRDKSQNPINLYKKKISAPPHIPRNPQGQPPKLTDDLIEEFCEHVKRIYYLETVANLLELDMMTINGWRRIGREENNIMKKDDSYVISDPHRERCHRFFIASRKAMALSEICSVAKISRDGSWQSSAWMLERRHPDRYGSQNHIIRQLERDLADIAKKLDKAYEEQSKSK